MNTPATKPVIWMGDSLERLQEFPATVQDEVGYAIYLAQVGAKHLRAKPLRGLGSGVLEVVSDHRGDTFRAVSPVPFGFRTGCTSFMRFRRNPRRASPRRSRILPC